MRGLFILDEASPVWAGVSDGSTWNGWEIPRFDRETARDIVEWFARVGDLSFMWWGDVLVIRFPEEDAFALFPDGAGLYRFDGWTWWEFDVERVAEDWELGYLGL